MMQQNAKCLQAIKWQPLHCAFIERLKNEKWIASAFADSTSMVLHMEAGYVRFSRLYTKAQGE